jgi:uncharacterized protein involved in exopolysaccharide biosynthesis
MAYDIAIPEDDSKTIQDYLDALRRRGAAAATFAAAVFVAGLIAIWFWPNSYRSTATILIEDPDIPPGLVPTTVTTFAARQIQYINQRVMTRTNLAEIIERFNLFPEERRYLPTLLLVEDVEDRVKIDVIDMPGQDASGQKVNSTIAFTVAFEHENPNTARQVANELVSLYLAENVRARTEQTAETSQFMQAEVDRLDAEVRDLESQIAKLKQENEGSLPEQSVLNLQSMERADGEIRQIDIQLQSLQESKVMLDAQLAQIEPMAPMIMPDGKGVAPPTDQLRALQSQLAMLEGRYSADHPDVVRVRRDVEALKAEVGDDVSPKDTDSRLQDLRSKLAMAQERYSEDHPEVMQLERQIRSLEQQQAADAKKAASGTPKTGKSEPNNPAYLQVRAQRLNLDTQEAALREQRARIQAKLGEYEQRINQSSDVERQLSALQRRLGTATASYQNARDRLFAAQLGQSMESQSKGERFTMVEPPDLPLVPASPNRPVLLALLIVLTLAIGFGWPQVAEAMDGSINSGRAIERVQGSAPIAEIPLIQTTIDKSHKRNVRLGVLVAAPIVVAVLALLVHFFWINLDVAWYVVVRRLGM